MKKIVLSIVFMAFGLMAWAKPVDSGTARQVAFNFWNLHRDMNVAALTQPMTQLACPFDGMYIFAAPEGGFVIVAADDRVEPILGYSFSSPANEELNPEVRYWLGTYQDQIEFLRENNLSAAANPQWADYLSAFSTDTPQPLTAVPTLLSTTWDQSPYYNKFCPYDSTRNARTVAGCVATAVAQVMKYWNHPAQGTGSHSYTQSPFGTLSANFGTTTYNWAQMPNALGTTSTTTQDNAVATLMYHVGVAIEMDYGVDASGAQLTNYGYSYSSVPSPQDALPMYFGYADNIQAKYRSRSNISDATWKNYVKGELDASRPVLYAGYDSEGGHCFVCDGYNSAETQFHFNWGWSGAYDGYYTLAALSPGGGGTGGNATYTFNDDQQILLGVQPAGYIPTVSDTLSYCGNNRYYSSIGTSGGPMYWGIMIPSSQLTGRNYLKSVLLYVHEAGNYTLKIYAGGTTTPGTLTHTQTFQCANADTTHWKEVFLNTLYSIDATQNLWITLYANGLQHPAAACTYTYESNSDWASTDGSSWSHLQELSSTLNYSWLLKAVTSANIPEVPPSVSISGPSRLTVGSAATFTATASSGTVTWSMPGATPATASGTTATFTYNTPGTYTVTATATNSSGSHSASQMVTVVTNDNPACTDTISYCGNREYSSSVGTSGGPMYWGITLTAAQLSGHTHLKSVMLYVREAGDYTLTVYAGGSGNNPGTAVHSQVCSINPDSEGWIEVVLNTNFAIPEGQNLWITFYAEGLQHPAATCAYTGDPNSDWASTDGSSWDHLQNLSSSLTYSWLIKAVTLTGNDNPNPNPNPNGIGDVETVVSTLYPNPASTTVTLTNLPAEAVVELYDIAGQQVTLPPTLDHATFNISDLAAGTYFFHIATPGHNTVSLKFIKQ